MKKSLGIFRNLWVYTFVSTVLAFLMVLTLLPHEILAQNIHTSADISPQLAQGETDAPSVGSPAPDATPTPTPADSAAGASDPAPGESPAPDLPAEPPEVATLEAADITLNSATLQGQLASSGSASIVQVFFEYGEDTSYGNPVAAQDLYEAGDFSISVQNLKPDTVYHYRARAACISGEALGEDVTFKTLAEGTSPETPPPDSAETNNSTPAVRLPIVNTNPASDITTNTATLSGTLVDLGSAEKVQIFIECANPEYYKVLAVPDMSDKGDFNINIEKLKPGTTYYYRTKAIGSTGESYGEKITFTTLPEESLINFTEPENDIPASEKLTVVVKPDTETEISSINGMIKLNIPKEAVISETNIELIENAPFTSTGMQIIRTFELNAYNLNTKEKVNQFNEDLQITIHNNEEDLAGIDIDSLRLYYLDEDTLEWRPLANNLYDRENNILTATTNHFSYYGEMGNPLINGPGRVMASQVDLSSGAATFTYPIELPPGPGGFQPKLDLSYNSSSLDEMKNRRDVGSWVGLGWSLHLPYISCDLASNAYYLNMNGISYKLITKDGFDYRTNPEQYYKISRNGQSWDMWDKEGIYYSFGNDSNSRQWVNNGIDYKYNLDNMEDTHGNQISVHYEQDIAYTAVKRRPDRLIPPPWPGNSDTPTAKSDS
jgi:hypothetical protein